MIFFHKKLISKEEEARIVSSIKEAELNTSGEIRVHVERLCRKEPLARAVLIFNKLKMFKTEQRNGVLVYVALKSRKFAIIGDTGINAVIPENFWDDIKNQLAASFSNGKITDGICTAVLSTGNLLKEKFPHKTNDVNEQSDDVSFG